MAVPKQKPSRSRTKSRRAKIYRAYDINSTPCPKCSEPKLPHRVCLHCGHYKGRKILEFESAD